MYELKPLDLLNEEVIRNVLTCVDRRKLQKNADTGRMERDGKVFTEAARCLGHYGEGWLKLDGESLFPDLINFRNLLNVDSFNRLSRRYRSSYKATLCLRRFLRKEGFLIDYKNPNLPFYSIDLKKVRASWHLVYFLYSLIRNFTRIFITLR